MEHVVTGTYSVILAALLLLAFVVAAGVVYYLRSNEQYDPDEMISDDEDADKEGQG